eukprot:6195317-Pleurochrysis_carterae.AAC.3
MRWAGAVSTPAGHVPLMLRIAVSILKYHRYMPLARYLYPQSVTAADQQIRNANFARCSYCILQSHAARERACGV